MADKPKNQTPVYSDDITLQNPIMRGAQAIASIKLRRPKTGELRGLNVTDLATFNVDLILKLVPRISEPPLLESELEDLDMIDLFSLTTEVANFLQPTESGADAPISVN